MPLQFIEREGFQICGYSVETTLAESENDVGALLQAYESGGVAQIDAIASNGSEGIYGLCGTQRDMSVTVTLWARKYKIPLPYRPERS